MGEGVLQRPHHRFLTDQVGEGLRPVFSGENLITVLFRLLVRHALSGGIVFARSYGRGRGAARR